MLEFLCGKILDAATSALDWLITAFLSAFGYDLDTFVRMFPIVQTLYNLIFGLSIGFVVAVAVFQLIKTMASAVFDERSMESPVHILLRAVFAVAAINIGPLIVKQVVGILQTPYNLFSAVGATPQQGFMEQLQKIIENPLIGIDVLARLVISIIMIVLLGVNIVKFLMAVVSRYVHVCIMTYTAPLAFATMASGATSDILKSWCKMLVSQFILLFLNLWVMKMIVSGMSSMNTFCAGGDIAGMVIWFLLLLELVKIAQRMDGYLRDLGLNAGMKTGASDFKNTAMKILSGQKMVSAAMQKKNHADKTKTDTKRGVKSDIPPRSGGDSRTQATSASVTPSSATQGGARGTKPAEHGEFAGGAAMGTQPQSGFASAYDEREGIDATAQDNITHADGQASQLDGTDSALKSNAQVRTNAVKPSDVDLLHGAQAAASGSGKSSAENALVHNQTDPTSGIVAKGGLATGGSATAQGTSTTGSAVGAVAGVATGVAAGAMGGAGSPTQMTALRTAAAIRSMGNVGAQNTVASLMRKKQAAGPELAGASYQKLFGANTLATGAKQAAASGQLPAQAAEKLQSACSQGAVQFSDGSIGNGEIYGELTPKGESSPIAEVHVASEEAHQAMNPAEQAGYSPINAEDGSLYYQRITAVDIMPEQAAQDAMHEASMPHAERTAAGVGSHTAGAVDRLGEPPHTAATPPHSGETVVNRGGSQGGKSGKRKGGA